MALSVEFSVLSKRAMCRVVAKLCSGLCVAMATLSITGCMSSVGPTVQATKQISGFSIASLQDLDLSDEILADAMSIQHAVSEAAPFNTHTLASRYSPDTPDTLGTSPLLWSNQVTGSQGEISYLIEKPSGNDVCKHFKSTRLSFEGVATYKGVSCSTSNGGWKLHSFFPVS